MSQPFQEPFLGHSFPVHSIMPVAMLKPWHHAFNVYGVANQSKKKCSHERMQFSITTKELHEQQDLWVESMLVQFEINSLGMEATLAALQKTD